MGVEVIEERTQSPSAQSVLFGEIPETQILVNHIIQKVQDNGSAGEFEPKNETNHINSAASNRNSIDKPAVITIDTDGKWMNFVLY